VCANALRNRCCTLALAEFFAIFFIFGQQLDNQTKPKRQQHPIMKKKVEKKGDGRLVWVNLVAFA